jgi:predicted RNA-binding protein with PUA-like domain
MTHYWLMKSEPGAYSIDDLKRDRKTGWSGVRNYQARNFMRDDMIVGDQVLFYHSNAEPSGVAGIAMVSKKAHPDPTALNPKDMHYDPKATKENPIWMMVEIKFVEKFPEILPLPKLRANPRLKGLLLLRPGQRLSVMPVEKAHFEMIRKMAGR